MQGNEDATRPSPEPGAAPWTRLDARAQWRRATKNRQAAAPDKPEGGATPSGGLYKERLVYKPLESHLEMVIVLTPTSLAISACVHPLERIKRALAAFSSLLALTPVPV